ncbi:hypothetical protein [Kitasatospora sp. NPDC001527]|uniref:hypothetical protein n=1 Tax=Kitasatospora sp. NPDC001527 TaxID=3154519 RepID=UPI0033255A7C
MTGTLRITSDCARLVAMFDWAVRTARTHVYPAGWTGPVNADEHRPLGTGTAPYLPTYHAGYRHRSAFYARDFAHQAVGAHLLGLALENATMLRAFAASATAGHGHHPVWACNFDGTFHTIDYHGPERFVRELPAVFELVETVLRLYRWTGDRTLVDDPVLWAFCRTTVTEFVRRRTAGSPVARGTGGGIFDGTASYHELSEERLVEAGDGIATQYRAYLAAAELATARGEHAFAARCAELARELKRYFNEEWSRVRPADGQARRNGRGEHPADTVRGYTGDGRPVTGWGREGSWFMPLKRIIDAGPRNERYLDYIDEEAAGADAPPNAEAYTYLPEVFFAHGRAETAWRWMTAVHDLRDRPHPVPEQGRNGDYPELSFTLVGQTVEGLLGLLPDAPAHRLSTLPGLPGAIGRVEVRDIPFGDGLLTLRHDGDGSTLTRSTGAELSWEARLPGAHTALTVDGQPRTPEVRTDGGVTYSRTTVRVAPGRACTVRVARPAEAVPPVGPGGRRPRDADSGR